MKALFLAISLSFISMNAFASSSDSLECAAAATKEEIIECLKKLEREKARLIKILVDEKDHKGKK